MPRRGATLTFPEKSGILQPGFPEAFMAKDDDAYTPHKPVDRDHAEEHGRSDEEEDPHARYPGYEAFLADLGTPNTGRW